MAIEFKDYYRTLGVPRTATEAEIKKAFRALARRYHPDIAKDKAAAEERFKEINEAYDVLSDPVKRRKYDQLGSRWQEFENGFASQAPGGGPFAGGWSRRAGPRTRSFRFGGSTGFSDFFEQFFGGASGGDPFEELFGRAGAGAGGRPSATTAAHLDTEADLLVTLEEMLRGGERTIRLERHDADTGETRFETIKVRIPPGVCEGQRLRVTGRGDTGGGGAHAGDLYLRVRLAAHPDYQVSGYDLTTEVPLAPWEAVLGTTVTVPLPAGGRASLKIPAGSQPGQKLRLRGRGLPRPDGTRGDVYALLAVELPDRVSAEERALWERLARTSRFRPRSSADPHSTASQP